MELEINGIVQGVGFRPFIHKVAKLHNVKGYVKNTSGGVFIELEGEKIILEEFLKDIRDKAPSLAIIESIVVSTYSKVKYFKDFTIIKSTAVDNEAFTLISPDVCICEDCLRELFDESDRRYRFPFINCTNCGPRFTIIKDTPYDRANTVMDKFELCDSCTSEYLDIEERRYHAQPDCCYECGPKLWFEDNKGTVIEGDAINIAREYLNELRIIAIKGLGGFHLACRIEGADFLRAKKHRDEKPLAIMCKNMETIRQWCYVSDREEELLNSYKRPIVLLKKRNRLLDRISMDNDYIGVMLPYTPVQYLLLEDELDTIIMTSGNISEVPIIYRNSEALKALSNIVDGFLLNNRDIHSRCDDSLIRIFNDREYPIRRSRGYVPFPIKVNAQLGKYLACGGEQKASFGLSSGGYVFMSPHIGDLKNIETLEGYEEQIENYKKLFKISPEAIVCDLHPDYLSSDYAVINSKLLEIPCYRVQHHHAHMAACMADNGLTGDVIGVIWDGTGYGLNGEIWGGECLVGGYNSFYRAGSIRKIGLLGGDRAVREIYRIGYSLLQDSFGYIPEGFKLCESESGREREREKEKVIVSLLSNDAKVIKTSSMGRLFDGVSAILGIKTIASYEGQGAIALEGIALEDDGYYEYDIKNSENFIEFDWRSMIRGIVKDMTEGIGAEIISSKFMNTLALVCGDMIIKIAQTTELNRIVLSGGVFQNIYLLNKVRARLLNTGFEVYIHNRVACNDEAIALGQIMVADGRKG